MHSDVRRTYPICISIGDCVASTSRKIMREVLATAHDLYVPAELSSDTYVRRQYQSTGSMSIFDSTGRTRQTVEL